MGELLQMVQQFFDEEGWSYSRIEGEDLLQLPFEGSTGRWLCWAHVREEQNQFAFYSLCPANVPPEQRAALAEFITRANYGLIVGNFDMDMADGEIRYKTSIDVTGARLTPELLRQMVYLNVTCMEAFLPAIMKAIYGDVRPEQALALVEGLAEPAA